MFKQFISVFQFSVISQSVIPRPAAAAAASASPGSAIEMQLSDLTELETGVEALQPVLKSPPGDCNAH